MKNVTVLNKKEKAQLNGGFALTIKPKKPSIDDWDPNIGWKDEGPNGDQYFPG